ncbi:MAG: hypothetical protein EB168_09210, partial [Euryarchaeota archaeon]|nr:hypothetical protein [Euryarchaeota archaeon]
MALLPVENIGSVGIHKDPPPYSLPPTTWSDGVNVRFTDLGVMKMPGYQEVMDNFPADKGTPMHIVFRNASIDVGDEDMWFVFTESHIMTYLNESRNWVQSASLPAGSTI